MADKVFKALRRTVVKHNAKTQILTLTVCMLWCRVCMLWCRA